MSQIDPRAIAAETPDARAGERPVGIPHRGEFLTGSLAQVRAPRAVVLIANDHGCARHDPGLLVLADELRRVGFTTLMVDVVRPGEQLPEREMGAVAARLHSVRAWLAGSKLAGMPLVLLGMGAVAPLALSVAATGPADVVAIIACGPRPDAAGSALGMVSCPSLLVAHGGRFSDLAAHVRALGRLAGRHDLAVLEESIDPRAGGLALARAATAFLAFIPPAGRRET